MNFEFIMFLKVTVHTPAMFPKETKQRTKADRHGKMKFRIVEIFRIVLKKTQG
jgi:hypothetical protein